MLIFTFNIVDIWFISKILVKKRYIAIKVLFITWKIEIINKNKFTIVVLDLKDRNFIIYIVFILGLI